MLQQTESLIGHVTLRSSVRASPDIFPVTGCSIKKKEKDAFFGIYVVVFGSLLLLFV